MLLKFVFIAFCTLSVVKVDAQLTAVQRTVQTTVQIINTSTRVTPAMRGVIASSGAVRQAVQTITPLAVANVQVMGLIQAYYNAPTLENVQAILTHPIVQQIAQQRLAMEYQALNLAFDRMAQAVENGEVTINQGLIDNILSSNVIQNPANYIEQYGRTTAPVRVQATTANMRIQGQVLNRQADVAANKEAARQLIQDVKNAIHIRANQLGPTTEEAQEFRTLANALDQKLTYLLDNHNIAILGSGALVAIQNWGNEHIPAIRNLIQILLSVNSDTVRVARVRQQLEDQLQMMFPTTSEGRLQQLESNECNTINVRNVTQLPDAA